MNAIFLDIETNGLNPDINSPLEICVSIYDLSSMLCIQEYSSLINCSERQYILSSDPKALEINCISLEEVVNAKMYNEVCKDLTEIFIFNEVHKKNSVFICQNPSFDRIFFNQIMPLETQEEIELPYHWLDLASMYFSRLIDVRKPINVHNSPYLIPLSKDSIASYLGIPPEKKPHRAKNGVHHLIECYIALMYNIPLK